MAWLTPLDATHTKTGGPPIWGLATRHSSCTTGFKSFLFTFLRTPWRAQKLNSFVFNRFRALCPKTPGWEYPSFPNGQRKRKHHGEILSRPCILTSLPTYFQKRQRPSRSDGGSCEKGAPSSGEKIVSSLELVVGRRRRRRRVRPPVELLNEHLVFARGHRVIRWHRKERSGRLR